MSAQPARSLSPLSEDKLALLARVTEGLDSDSLLWVSGYFAGVASSQRRAPLIQNVAAAPQGAFAAVAAIEVAAAPAAAQRLTIVYGSQTGNAKRQAEALAQQSEAAGLGVRLVRADAYPTRELAHERLLYIVISTQGDGDPPDDARGFVEFLVGKRAPKLPQLKFAVLGLGDSSYPQFCAIGAKLDARLAELGATRLIARGDADLDIATVAEPWGKQALDHARDVLKSDAPAAPLATVTPLRAAAAAHVSAWTREKPFTAALLANQRISARDGSKDIRHIELSLEGANLAYEPGDALGVWATNPPALVDALLTALRFDGASAIALHNETTSLREWLLRKREITGLNKPFLAAHAQRAQHADLARALTPEGKDALRRLLAEYQLIDLVREFPASWSAEEFVAALRPLAPRLYSIASSRKAVGDEAHLTAAVLDYEAFGTRHVGAASHHLANLADDAGVPVFIETNERFRLPADASRDVIMIGPGTGVAPFRGFVQERAETRSMTAGAGGRNWLFFGNPHFRTDFLYQIEWQQALKAGTLHRLDLAFSRDQSEKVYVQHTLRRRGKELYDWIQNGAHVYVCGDATRMAADVETALRDIFIEHGGKSEDDAREALSDLAAQRRYSRDVY
ncbi:MAG: assimilatory sulfite reductase (NADPH) flavoprotein subunit [Gammaproteobacteria bacterium]|nr:MAG: assimilatory sulfite reductase (NADPH) flavoprotein subunit [Gammaproteobacteria bacterium]